MKKLFIVLLFKSFIIFSQDLQSSKTYVNTCYNKQQCFSLNNSSFIFYNEENSELTILIDFMKFKIGNDTLDEWLDDLDNTKLIFKGHLTLDNLLDLSQHNSKANTINGVISFNGVSHAHSIEITLYEIPSEGMLHMDNQNNYYNRISANFQFGFYPKEFKINKKPHHLTKKITLAIYRGHINPFKPGMEHWLKT